MRGRNPRGLGCVGSAQDQDHAEDDIDVREHYVGEPSTALTWHHAVTVNGNRNVDNLPTHDHEQSNLTRQAEHKANGPTRYGGENDQRIGLLRDCQPYGGRQHNHAIQDAETIGFNACWEDPRQECPACKRDHHKALPLRHPPWNALHDSEQNSSNAEHAKYPSGAEEALCALRALALETPQHELLKLAERLISSARPAGLGHPGHNFRAGTVNPVAFTPK
mmetsp:Transcript_44960/g.144047  ORF Transcript_44960/g.144047 Transcript_44960/m.144047 type:complete len:221 (-) Transcript_44960:146-808(-)